MSVSTLHKGDYDDDDDDDDDNNNNNNNNNINSIFSHVDSVTRGELRKQDKHMLREKRQLDKMKLCKN